MMPLRNHAKVLEIFQQSNIPTSSRTSLGKHSFATRSDILSVEKYTHMVNEMTTLCLSHNSDIYQLHLHRTRGLKIIKKILKNADPSYVSTPNMLQMVWCLLSCIHHFQIREKHTKAGKRRGFCPNRNAEKAMKTFDMLMLTFTDFHKLILRAIVLFLKEAKLWDKQFISNDILVRYIKWSCRSKAVVYELILAIEELATAKDMEEVKQVYQVLNRICSHYQWPEMSENSLDRLYRSFFSWIKSGNDDYSITKTMETCLKNILDSLSNTHVLVAIRILFKWINKDGGAYESILLEMGSMLEYAAINHDTKLYNFIPIDIIQSIVDLISSRNMLHSLLGNRVLQNLIDRCANKDKLKSPQIFYENVNYDILVNVFYSEDRKFLKKHRESLHQAVLQSLFNHGRHQTILESTYTTIALLMLEIPCAYNAAAGVCLAMAIQEQTFENDLLTINQTHRLHATVMAIMSLICHIYNAKVFYEYLNTILKRRAEFAPHLNPPLNFFYEYNPHHVHWDKPELFFEDWEVRYGLWKCFKSHDKPVAQIVKNKQ